jgi:hypothetical protein
MYLPLLDVVQQVYLAWVPGWQRQVLQRVEDWQPE